MINVLIWDYVGVSAQWINDFTDKKDFHIVGTITPADPVPEILLQKDAWDWLLIFEQGTRNFFDATIRLLNLPPDKVIYALDINSWAQHPKGLFALTNPQRGGQLHLYFNFIVNQNLNNFVTCTAEDCSYVATAKDSTIMRSMCLHRKNFSSKTMNTFHRLTEKYYGMSDGGGCFWTWARTSARREFISSKSSRRI